MKMIYILSHFYCEEIGKLILWSPQFAVIFFTVTVLKFHYVKDHFPKMLWSSAFFPYLWSLPLISVFLYPYIWKKFLMVVIGISVNHIFNATAPDTRPLIEVLHVWMKAFLVGFISVIAIYWFLIFYWYYTWQNLMG